MANGRSGNVLYVDTAGTVITAQNVQVLAIILTGVGGAAVMELGNLVAAASYPAQLYAAAASGTTVYIPLHDAPMIFPNGIRCTTATNLKATLIVRTT